MRCDNPIAFTTQINSGSSGGGGGGRTDSNTFINRGRKKGPWKLNGTLSVCFRKLFETILHYTHTPCVCVWFLHDFCILFYVLHFKILIGSDRAATKRKEKKKNGEKPKPILCHNLKLCFKFVCARFLSFTFQPLCSIIIRSDSNIGRVNGDHDRKFSFTKNFINAKIRSHIKTWNKTTANLKEKMNFESLAFIGTHSHIYRYKLCTFQVLCNLFNVFFFPSLRSFGKY